MNWRTSANDTIGSEASTVRVPVPGSCWSVPVAAVLVLPLTAANGEDRGELWTGEVRLDDRGLGRNEDRRDDAPAPPAAGVCGREVEAYGFRLPFGVVAPEREPREGANEDLPVPLRRTVSPVAWCVACCLRGYWRI